MAKHKCDCGKIFNVNESNIVGGQESCGCLKRKFTSESKWKGCGEVSLDYFSNIKRGAEARGLEFNVDIEYLWELFLSQGGKCGLSGLEIKLSRNTKYYKATASLDRIDSNVGYVKNNLQWIHKDINKSKNNLNKDEYIKICSAIAEYKLYGKTNIVLDYDEKNESFPSGNSHKNWKGFGEIGHSVFSITQRGAISRKIEFDITIEDMWNLFLEQDRKCALTGNKLYFTSNRRKIGRAHV